MGWRYGISGTLLRDGVLAGLVSTTAMNFGYWAERRIRRNVHGPLDYDDSNVPALVAAKILRQSDLSDVASFRLGLAVHWGYGSLFGLAAVPLNRRFRPATATAVYWGAMMVMACAMFPILGGTPPPWRWRRDVIVTSVCQHLVYAGTTTTVLRALAQRQRHSGRVAPEDVALAGDEASVDNGPDVVTVAGGTRGTGGTGVTAGTGGSDGTSGAPGATA